MRNKKMLSAMMAGALAVTTMAVPVMATATDGGQVDVDVTTKTGVLRVSVPTTLAIAVDQFEITQAGAQIASGEFDITNLSEMAVKVAVTSTVELAATNPITLVATKEAAANSEGNEAWLAVAAKTGANSYDVASTADKTEAYYDLTEANANVATFASDTKKAEQTFYLEKATGTVAYKYAKPDTNGKVKDAYAKFYELNDVTINADSSTETTQLQTAVNANDVYVVDDTTSDPAVDGKTMTKIAKGTDLATATPAITWAATNKYYTAADSASTTLASGKVYVYSAMGTAGTDGSAGFTYVGKLSNAKDTWTKDDIKKVSIAYTITGVTASKYDEVKDDCTYGLYSEPREAARITIDTDGTITMKVTAEDYKGLVVNDGEADYEMNSTRGTWVTWDEEGDTQVFKLGDAWVEHLRGKTATAILTLQDDTEIESEPVEFPAE